MKKNKTEIKFIEIFIFAMVFALAGVITNCGIEASESATKYNNAKGNIITIEAVVDYSIKDIYEDDDGMEDISWDVYVTYEYNGKTYEDVYYKNLSKQPTDGTKVYMMIDPENPGEMLPSEGEYYGTLVGVPIGLTVAAFIIYWIITSIMESIFKNAYNERKRVFIIIAIVFVVCKQVIESVLVYMNKGSFFYGAFSAIALLVFGGILILSKKKANPENEVINQTETVQG